MARAEKSTTDEGNEFAEFMADISQEIAQRVESLNTPTESRVRDTKTPVALDPGVIVDWADVSDRMIEEMR